MRSVFGWPLRISTSPNRRTLYNFPMQSNGAEMLRLAACRLCEVGIVPCMLIHDGLLIEAKDMEQVEQAKDIMRAAGREVCDGLDIGVDTDQLLLNGARYRDKREVAKKMWATMMRTLQEIGALPEGSTMKYVYRHGERIAVDIINTATPAQMHKPLEVSFVQFPYFWIDQLMRANNPGAFKLAFQILKEAFKRQLVGGEIVLSTEITELPREVRRRAVRELVQLGLIKIEQSGNRAIRVTSIIKKKKRRKE